MSITRIIILFRRDVVSSIVSAASIPVFVLSIIGLSYRFLGFHQPFLPLLLESLPLLIGAAGAFGFIQSLREEKINRTAEMLFSTPITTREYMFSLWLRGMVISLLAIYLAMGAFVLALGIEHLADVSPFVWVQPLFLVGSWVAGSGLVMCIVLRDSSIIKKIAYFVIVFGPIVVVTILVLIMFIAMLMNIGDLSEPLPSWLSRVVETLQTIERAMPAFVRSPLFRWLPTSVYMIVWFFILNKNIHVGNLIFPVSRWFRMFVPW